MVQRPLYGEVADQRPTLKRRHTHQTRAQSPQGDMRDREHSRAPRGMSVDVGDHRSSREKRPAGRRKHREDSFREISNSSSQSSVLFTIDGSGRAKAERTLMEEDANRRSQHPVLWDIEDEDEEVEDARSATSDSDMDISASRNTSFAVPDANRRSSKRGRLGIQHVSRRYEASISTLQSFETDGYTTHQEFVQILGKQAVQERRIPIGPSEFSDQNVSGMNDVESEAETVVDGLSEAEDDHDRVQQTIDMDSKREGTQSLSYFLFNRP